LTLSLFVPKDAEQKESVCKWVSDVIDGRPMFCYDDPKLTAMAFVNEGKIVIGVVFHNYRETDIEMACAVLDRKSVNRGVLRLIYSYPFIQLGCTRVTSIVDRNNKDILKFNRRLGYVPEGVIRRAFGDHDAILFGMLREECPWIKVDTHG